jgi:hypothetical protein
MADMPVFPGEAPQQVEEDILRSGLLGGLVERPDSGQRQEHAVLVAKLDRFAQRAVLVLFEDKLPQVIVGLLSFLRLDTLDEFDGFKAKFRKPA